MPIRHVAVRIFALCATAATALAPTAHAAPPLDEKPKMVKIAGDDGGRLDGQPWSSEMITGKVWSLFYVDPDEKSANEELEQALKAQQFPKDRYGSIAVINMAATWLPNAAIASTLESKQKEFPETVYVKDLKKVLVKEWAMKDDSYDVLLFDKQGKLIFAKDGPFAKADMEALIAAIKKNL